VGRPAPSEHVGDDVYTSEEIERIRAAGKIAAGAVEAVGAAIAPGVTTDQLDAIAHDFVVNRGYPKSCCTSINETICHGIPDNTVIAEGDIVNIDITAFKDGMHGDLNKTFIAGDASDDATLLVERTEEALRRAIMAVVPGRQINVIGRAIEAYASRFGYGVVRDFTGHGVGRSFHSGLIIPHYDASPQFDQLMVPGMVFTIEPMLTLGTIHWDMWSDGWTVTTKDKSLSAQFEHTLVVTETGAEILTLP
jgi:methionyl aminopeptidase